MPNPTHPGLDPNQRMISLIAQERLLGAALGGLVTSGVVLEQRRGIYRSISDAGPSSKPQYFPKESLTGKISQADLAHLWNKTVDGTLGPVIKYLSSHGW